MLFQKEAEWVPNQTGISQIFRAHSLRRLLVPGLEWEGKGREERESETLVFKTGWMWKFESCCAGASQTRRASVGSCSSAWDQPAQCTATHTLGAILSADLTFTLGTLTSQRTSSELYSLTHNCSWRICGWAPTLDKDYRRYKSWTMAPLLTQN